jgi:hypothetical protein
MVHSELKYEGTHKMKRAILVMAVVSFSLEFVLAFGSSDALAQSLENYYQVTGDEFGHREPDTMRHQ